MSITISDLVGRHILTTAAIFSEIPYGRNESKQCVSVGIDGNTYTFVEDPNDGYRSYLEEVLVEPGINEKLALAPLINREVLIVHYEGNASRQDDLIQIYDMDTGHLWSRIGTENTDDYYPYCILEWNAMEPNGCNMKPLKAIPISAAKAVAETFGYDQVIIYGRKVGDAGGEHMTTYGTNPAHCEIAAKMGDVLKKFMGWEV